VSSLGLRIILLTSETAQQNQSLFKANEYSDGTGLTDKVTFSTAPRWHRQRARSSITDAKYVWTIGLSAAASGCITLPNRLCLNRLPTAFREILGVTPVQISASLNLSCNLRVSHMFSRTDYVYGNGTTHFVINISIKLV